MSSLQTFTKQNYEQFYIAGDISDFVESGEAISLTESSVVAEDKDSVDVSSVVLEQATKSLFNNDLYLRIRCREGAEAVSPYKITFRIKTTLDNRWEIDARMLITEQ